MNVHQVTCGMTIGSQNVKEQNKVIKTETLKLRMLDANYERRGEERPLSLNQFVRYKASLR